MAKKNVFVSNAKEISIGTGKVDLATATAEFKEKVQMFATGINALNDASLKFSECINTEKKALENYEKGSYVDSAEVERRQALITEYTEKRDAVRSELFAKMPEFDKVDKNLYYAYRQYVTGEVGIEIYTRAFAEFLDNAGVVPATKGINFIMSKIGVNKASARAMCKNGGTVFTNAKGEKQFLDLVYRVIADLMTAKQILKPYTYEYIIVDKKKNA